MTLSHGFGHKWLGCDRSVGALRAASLLQCSGWCTGAMRVPHAKARRASRIHVTRRGSRCGIGCIRIGVLEFALCATSSRDALLRIKRGKPTPDIESVVCIDYQVYGEGHKECSGSSASFTPMYPTAAMLTGTVRTALYGAYTVGRGALHTSAYSLGGDLACYRTLMWSRIVKRMLLWHKRRDMRPKHR